MDERAQEDQIAAALSFLLREFDRRGTRAREKAAEDQTMEAAALRGKAVAYREARDAIDKVMRDTPVRRRWQRLHRQVSVGR